VCQLDVLRNCIKLDKLRKALNSLPKTLNETYNRILLNIEEGYKEEAFRVLQWLVFSARPVTVEEVVEVLPLIWMTDLTLNNGCQIHGIY
jgi:hypothetical protein